MPRLVLSYSCSDAGPAGEGHAPVQRTDAASLQKTSRHPSKASLSATALARTEDSREAAGEELAARGTVAQMRPFCLVPSGSLNSPQQADHPRPESRLLQEYHRGTARRNHARRTAYPADHQTGECHGEQGREMCSIAHEDPGQVGYRSGEGSALGEPSRRVLRGGEKALDERARQAILTTFEGSALQVTIVSIRSPQSVRALRVSMA